MSKIIIEGPIQSTNTQIGDQNIQVISKNDITEIDWDIILKEVEKVVSKNFEQQKEYLLQVIKSKDGISLKSLIKNRFGDYCVGVLTELSSVGLIEIMKLFV